MTVTEAIMQIVDAEGVFHGTRCLAERAYVTDVGYVAKILRRLEEQKRIIVIRQPRGRGKKTIIISRSYDGR